jgi:hypothetical protein
MYDPSTGCDDQYRTVPDYRTDSQRDNDSLLAMIAAMAAEDTYFDRYATAREEDFNVLAMQGRCADCRKKSSELSSGLCPSCWEGVRRD